MHQPVIGDNPGKKLARKFVKFCESWFIKTIARPIFFILPPMLLTALATRQGLLTSATKYLPEQASSFLTDSAFTILVGAYIYVVLMKSLYSAIHSYSKPSRELGVKDILSISKTFEIIVSDKYKRMSKEASSALKKPSICPADTFLTITKPEQQLALLTTGIRAIFEQLDETQAFFRVGLLKVVNNKPEEWVSFDPMSHPPRTEPQQLASPASTVSNCIKKKTIVIVEDIQKSLNSMKDKRYLACNTQANDNGSQLCYPIIHASTGKTEYVITVAGNKKGCLKEKHADIYAWLLNQFALRMSLEHSLLILKEKANGQKQTP